MSRLKNSRVSKERRALRLSIWGAVSMAALGLGFAIPTSSEAVLLDGVFSLLGGALAVAASCAPHFDRGQNSVIESAIASGTRCGRCPRRADHNIRMPVEPEEGKAMLMPARSASGRFPACRLRASCPSVNRGGDVMRSGIDRILKEALAGGRDRPHLTPTGNREEP